MALTKGRLFFLVVLINEDVSDPRLGLWKGGWGPRSDLKERGREGAKQEKE